MPRLFARLATGVVVAVIVALAAIVLNPHVVGTILFTRPGTRACVPLEELGHGPAMPVRQMTAEEIEAFSRDGSVRLQGMLDPVWVSRLQGLVRDCFAHPNIWDVLYSRLIANFYCAQKAILVHHTSVCGRQIAEAAPTTHIATELLRSASLRVCEPSDALGNFRRPVEGTWGGLVESGCGTTGFHTDDAYIPVRRRDADRPAVARLWMPLVPFSGRHFRFATLNQSAAARAARAAAGNDDLHGTSYARDEQLAASGILSEPGQVIEGDGLVPGDIFAFAGETPHIATALDCDSNEAHGCLRLILSFAGDNALFVGGRSTGLIPLHDNQTDGQPPRGVQFPEVFPDMPPDDWLPLRPSVATLGASLWYAMRAGAGSFAGFSPAKQATYIMRVAWFAAPWTNFWDYPDVGDATATDADGAGAAARPRRTQPLSLARHFGGAVLEWSGLRK